MKTKTTPPCSGGQFIVSRLIEGAWVPDAQVLAKNRRSLMARLREERNLEPGTQFSRPLLKVRKA